MNDRLLVLSALAALMAGCSGATEDQQGQVIARVNDADITIHQLNLELEQEGLRSDQEVRVPVQPVIQHLVDRELLAQQAYRIELERIPPVMLAMERARDQVLADYYLDQLGGGSVEPAADELSDYYVQHPALFSERRIYDIRQLIIELSGGADTKPGAAQVVEQLDKDEPIDKLMEWLESGELPYRLTHIEEAAERLPEPVLDKLVSMEPGQRSRIELGEGIVVVYLLSAKPAPLSMELALPEIKRILVDAKRRQLVESEIEKLRSKAAIVYMFDDPAKLPLGEHQ